MLHTLKTQNSFTFTNILRRFYLEDLDMLIYLPKRFIKKYKFAPVYQMSGNDLYSCIPSDDLQYTKHLPQANSSFIYNHQLFPPNYTDKPKKIEQINGSTTLWYLYKCLDQNKPVPTHCYEDAFVLKNMFTLSYKTFIAEIESQWKNLLYEVPETRYTISTIYKALTLKANISSDYIHQVIIPPEVISVASINDVPTIDDEGNVIDYVEQPYIQGFRLMMSMTSYGIKVRSKYGKKVSDVFMALNYYVPKTTFSAEIILVPMNANNQIQSWHTFGPGSNMVAFLLDLYIYDNKPLSEMVLSERLNYGKLIYDDFIKPLPPVSEMSVIFDAICGKVYRPNTPRGNKKIYAVKYIKPLCYDYIAKEMMLVDDYNILRAYKVYQNYTADKIVRMIAYSNDDEYIYIASFDVDLICFVHRFTLKLDPLKPKIIYKYNNVAVLNAKRFTIGFAVLSIYFLNNGTILGYDQKITHSYLDQSLDYI